LPASGASLPLLVLAPPHVPLPPPPPPLLLLALLPAGVPSLLGVSSSSIAGVW
jgi:hypothetical protein